MASRGFDDLKFNGLPGLAILSKVFHNFKTELHLHVSLILFVGFKFFLGDSSLVQIIKVNKKVWFITIQNNKSVVFSLVKKF